MTTTPEKSNVKKKMDVLELLLKQYVSPTATITEKSYKNDDESYAETKTILSVDPRDIILVSKVLTNKYRS